MNVSELTIGNNLKSKDSNLMTEIDKHIEIKFLKEGRRNKTYIYGLSDYMTGDNKDTNLTKFVEKLKKKLGTSMVEEEKDGKKYFGFGGDHVDVIKNIIIADLKIPRDKIKT